jgi:hypothetical protein
MMSELPPMKSFLLPGGHVAVSTAHIARCVCRRAERACVRLQEEQLFVEPLVLRYLNRLSDYLFVLARYTAQLLYRSPRSPGNPALKAPDLHDKPILHMQHPVTHRAPTPHYG